MRPSAIILGNKNDRADARWPVSIGKRRDLRLRRHLQLATPRLPFGMGLQWWLLILIGGVTPLVLGFSFLLREFYPLPSVFYDFRFQCVPRGTGAALLALVGPIAIGVELLGANSSLPLVTGWTAN
jgi:hypothetical protein